LPEDVVHRIVLWRQHLPVAAGPDNSELGCPPDPAILSRELCNEKIPMLGGVELLLSLMRDLALDAIVLLLIFVELLAITLMIERRDLDGKQARLLALLPGVFIVLLAFMAVAGTLREALPLVAAILIVLLPIWVEMEIREFLKKRQRRQMMDRQLGRLQAPDRSRD